MKIKFETELPINVKMIEEKYNATYVGDFCVKTHSGVYDTQEAAIFWQETPPVEGYSNYFAIVIRNGQPFITDGYGAVENSIVGAIANDGEIIYSRHRWDCRHSKDGSIFIDGGRDYVRTNARNFCTLEVIGPDIFVFENGVQKEHDEN
ncbi:MAG TPA: hypothetical protein VFM18_06670 [Methanosarcina sp.]|nr:hypothetical protein [Methanosarcina sp.]